MNLVLPMVSIPNNFRIQVHHDSWHEPQGQKKNGVASHRGPYTNMAIACFFVRLRYIWSPNLADTSSEQGYISSSSHLLCTPYSFPQSSLRPTTLNARLPCAKWEVKKSRILLYLMSFNSIVLPFCKKEKDYNWVITKTTTLLGLLHTTVIVPHYM